MSRSTIARLFLALANVSLTVGTMPTAAMAFDTGSEAYSSVQDDIRPPAYPSPTVTGSEAFPVSRRGIEVPEQKLSTGTSSEAYPPSLGMLTTRTPVLEFTRRPSTKPNNYALRTLDRNSRLRP